MSGRGGYGRGGRGGGGGGRGGGRGGGGGQRWWDPEWRAQKLAEMGSNKGPRAEMTEAKWREIVGSLRSGGKPEVVLKENYGREGADEIHAMAAAENLYSKGYGRGRNTVLVVSTVPLPNYRADLDAKLEGQTQHVGMSERSKAMLQDVLNGMPDVSDVRSSASTSGSLQNQLPVKRKHPGAVPEGAEESMAAEQDPSAVSARLMEEQKERASLAAYKASMAGRKKLPSYAKKEEVIATVAAARVTVISGETGCGKTTQVPQFILDAMVESQQGAACSIICTQPRRISAISVAERVASERCEALGKTVGYQIRLENRRSAETRLLFCTTGVLLRRLTVDKQLKGVSHVIVDEIHERGINEDFILIVLKDLLQANPGLKLILMSATLNARQFSSYFDDCPILHIPGFTHPVEDIFLEDVLGMIRYDIPAGGSSQQSFGGGFDRRKARQERAAQKEKVANANSGTDFAGASAVDAVSEEELQTVYAGKPARTKQSLANWDPEKMDLELVMATVEHICAGKEEGAVLVFLSGWDEISKLLDMMKAHRVLGDAQRIRLLPLHGSMPTVNQREIFDRPPAGVRKVLLSTNIAETSITIDDVVFVVDTGKSKQKTYDPVNNLACLLPAWISKANARQRRGRAGRVQAGKCFHLYPSGAHEVLEEYQLPEILRTPLEELCLQIKALSLGYISPFLEKALEPPPQLSVQNAIDLLVTIGAFTPDGSEELTALGRHLSTLPVDPKVGKMLLYGCVMQCLPPVLTIAAGMAYKDPWVLPIDKKQAADEARRRFAGESCSDHIALLQAYNGWTQAGQGRRDYCWRNYLSSNTLDMMADMRRQFVDLLKTAGFIDSDCPRPLEAHSQFANNHTLVKAVLAAGMVPNVATARPGKREAKWHTIEDGKVKPHPSSVNSFVSAFPARWIVYNQKVKSSDIFIRDSTCISDFAMLLFGGQLSINDNDGSLSMLKGYATFAANPEVQRLVVGLRQQLDGILLAKVQDPTTDLDRSGAALVAAVVKLLSSEDHDAQYGARRDYYDDEDEEEDGGYGGGGGRGGYGRGGGYGGGGRGGGGGGYGGGGYGGGGYGGGGGGGGYGGGGRRGGGGYGGGGYGGGGGARGGRGGRGGGGRGRW